MNNSFPRPIFISLGNLTDSFQPISCSDVMKGFESTIFAYGQTGTGKTHTMEGSLASPDLYGIIPRSAEAIFEAVSNPDVDSHFVRCSYLEIYNEDLRDLLVDTPKKSSRTE